MYLYSSHIIYQCISKDYIHKTKIIAKLLWSSFALTFLRDTYSELATSFYYVGEHLSPKLLNSEENFKFELFKEIKKLLR